MPEFVGCFKRVNNDVPQKKWGKTKKYSYIVGLLCLSSGTQAWLAGKSDIEFDDSMMFPVINLHL